MSAPAPWLLALHSSSDTLAVGLQRLPEEGAGAAAAREPLEPPRLACFPLGRRLSNELIPCVETLLPAEHWRQLGRLVVATGPGGFTGTRLSVVWARTLAQQLAIPLHGFSSFLLMARRLGAPGPNGACLERFWLTQELPRRGVVAGCYQADATVLGGMAERVAPQLFKQSAGLVGLQRPAVVEPEADVAQLLELGQRAAAARQPGPWQPVLPLYPTSPVDGL